MLGGGMKWIAAAGNAPPAATSSHSRNESGAMSNNDRAAGQAMIRSWSPIPSPTARANQRFGLVPWVGRRTVKPYRRWAITSTVNMTARACAQARSTRTGRWRGSPTTTRR
jgi:hypothetical protein